MRWPSYGGRVRSSGPPPGAPFSPNLYAFTNSSPPKLPACSFYRGRGSHGGLSWLGTPMGVGTEEGKGAMTRISESTAARKAEGDQSRSSVTPDQRVSLTRLEAVPKPHYLMFICWTRNYAEIPDRLSGI